MAPKLKTDQKGLSALFSALKASGFQIIAPSLEDEAIVLREISSIEELPKGRREEVEPGKYRLIEDPSAGFFGPNLAAQGFRRFLYPPEERLWQGEKAGASFRVLPDKSSAQVMALVGIRPCELAAIKIQDRVFDNGVNKDAHYFSRRDKAFLVVVNCTQALPTCNCRTFNTGPQADNGGDIVLTEIGTEFLVEAISEKAQELVSKFAWGEADPALLNQEKAALKKAFDQMAGNLDPDKIAQGIKDSASEAVWDKIAARCLSCGSCTLVCPTCFCSTVEDKTDLSGAKAERVRSWDSCFSLDHSYIHGGNIRRSGASRYRQWMSHKLAYWQDQFGTAGCVGCGRCTIWCPVGINFLAEASALAAKGI